MPAPNVTYGFIGLGQMGHGMAKNLRQKIPESSILVIFDINKETMQRFVQEHGQGGNVKTASSPKEIAQVADIVLTSVPQARHVSDVFLHPTTGLLSVDPAKKRKILFLELSTIDALASFEIAEKVASGGFGDFVDAPCSGGAMGSESGNLSFMIGSPDELYPRVFEICKLLGKEDNIFHCGGLGSGLKTKLLNNYLSSLTALATAETINIGIKGGLDARLLNKVLNASSGMNFNSITNNPVPGLTPGNAASKGYVGGFSLELCLAVLELGYKNAQDLGAKTVLGTPMLEAFRDAAKDPAFQGKDSKIIYRWLGGIDP
ncbi:hypothetical protein PISL3812_01461 [Talaromyces islandicus]|uniref:3-hydroxyisobutyrate dehydrogenase n=1 Tax=Talaromyces islandicus TaxID=28573 RepID=A0A0U1LM65_TALIS|nr:hypothetical protein PISL3812_01461 [Talaromyces islandicus]